MPLVAAVHDVDLVAAVAELTLVDNNNNNNTGYLLHAISPKSKEHIACHKHYNKLQIHCCKTLLRNIVTVTEH